LCVEEKSEIGNTGNRKLNKITESASMPEEEFFEPSIESGEEISSKQNPH
jgi:hypothetical protein